MRLKERVIFDSRDAWISEKDAIESIKEWRKDNGEDPEEPISSDDIYEEQSTMNEVYWSDFNMQFMDKGFFENVLLMGQLHFWNGKPRGVKYCATDADFRRSMSGYNDIRLVFEGKRLYLYLYHHDGTHCLEVRQLSNKGERRKRCLEEKYEDLETEALEKFDIWMDTYTHVFKGFPDF